MKVSVAYDFLPKRRSVNASIVMDHFGIDFEQGRHVIAEDLELSIEPGDVVFFTGPSGSGKSSLMRAVAAELEQDAEPITDLPLGGRGKAPRAPVGGAAGPGTRPDGLCPSHAPVLRIDELELGDAILVDALDLPAREALGLLSQCGLSEAQLLLRTPAELSDGQRYRFRLAKAMSRRPRWIVADEFTASLDRTLARVIAYNVRRLADARGMGVLAATTHEDVVEDLDPDVLVRCDLDGAVEIQRRRAKKNESAWHETFGSARRPQATGVTSLGGITEATGSVFAGG
jgi:hypothetical protein